MFAQVITFKVTDAVALRAALDKEQEDVAPGAIGRLGETSGVTSDGTAVIIVRYETAEDAHRNAARPEHLKWYSEASALVSRDVEIKDSVEVIDDIVGDPDSAGFVQVIQGRFNDLELARDLGTRNRGAWAEFRPDILGTRMIIHGSDEYSMAVYFTNELAAREGEQKQPPVELLEHAQQMAEVVDGEPTYYDLKQPWLTSDAPRGR